MFRDHKIYQKYTFGLFRYNKTKQKCAFGTFRYYKIIAEKEKGIMRISKLNPCQAVKPPLRLGRG